MKVFFVAMPALMAPSEVVGIDKSKVAVDRAKARFPDCQFFAQSWEQLPEGKFDVILLASALHYAEDQAALIHRLMDSLQDDGTLVLEIGLAPSGESEWVRVKRSIDERLFPSRGKLGEILDELRLEDHRRQRAAGRRSNAALRGACSTAEAICLLAAGIACFRQDDIGAESFLPRRRSR
jgi:SAM-dependent methyltransferase